MADERYYEVVITRSTIGVIRVDESMRSFDGEDFEKIAEELAEMDEGWEKGSRVENTDNIEILDITAQQQARLAKATDVE